MDNKINHKKYDVIVVGGGMSGLCAAIASARHGSRTALVHDRPVLGGNASSEIKMHIVGADCHGTRANARETGIIEEILLQNKKENPQKSFSVLDTIMWEKANFQDHLDLYLNCHMYDVLTKGNNIESIKAKQLTTEKEFVFEGNIFIDATGDGLLGYLAGAEYRQGREGKDAFGEFFAPELADNITMGNSLMFKTIDMGRPVPFEKPFWANTYTEEFLSGRGHQLDLSGGYWWIELGGDELNTINDGEEIRDELLKAVYGIWDHIKNGGDHGADNLALEWVGFLPGKRESRRLVGDYILKEQDLMEGKIFDDAVAYGGWPLDLHHPGGLKYKEEPLPKEIIEKSRLKEIYTIPYRCLHSKNIDNLMLGGRSISVSHVAFGSTRVMATCAIIGQAVGTAAAMALDKKIMPRDVLNHIRELQQTLIKDDCYIPCFKNEDMTDIAKQARISSSSNAKDCHCMNLINGYSRTIKGEMNCWMSECLSTDGEWVCFEFNRNINPKEMRIKFDSDLSREHIISITDWQNNKQTIGVPQELVKDYEISFYNEEELVHSELITNNYLRYRIHLFENIICNKIKISVLSTNGYKNAKIFEVGLWE